ncbi:MAG: rhomboid family intramembrane serine protease [Deltaproteobacteria bacterium]|nr:MAG: rhomboid family intramembrane serine protease [Deltaproteobacteria bacterium]
MSKTDRAPISTPIPWLSAALLLAFVAFSVHARLRSEQLERDGMVALDAARAYYLEHPYLQPGPALTARVGAGIVQRARSDYEQQLRAGSIPTPPGVVRRQQSELDQQVAAAIASVSALPAQRVAFAPGTSPPHTWLAYCLLHVGNAALIGNGLLVLFFGVYLERSFGRGAYAGLLVWLTLAGAAGWVASAPADAVHGLVGSTPLLAGLAAAFATRFFDRREEGFYLAGLLASILWLALPPWASAGWSFAPLELVATQPPPAPTAVYLPCLSAVVAAAIGCTLAWLTGIDGEAAASESPAGARDPRLRRALRAREAGRPREALELLGKYLADEPDSYEAAVAAWEVARELGRDSEITASQLRVIRIELRRGLAAAAMDHWLDLVRGGIPEHTEASLLIHIALLLREHDHKPEAVRALRFALEHSEERENHVIAMRIARAARGLDPGTSETAAWRALGSVELSLKDRQALESLIGELLATPDARAAWLASASGGAWRARASGGDASAAAARRPAAIAPPAAAPDPAPIAASTRPAAIEIERNDRVLDAVLAVPLELKDDGVEIQTSQGQKKLVRYERIEAVSVAAVHGMAPKPVIVIDLVLNWMTPKNETLRVIRMRGDQFDPRRLRPGQSSAIEALRAFVKTVIDRSEAIALPDVERALGRPFASFEELVIYQRVVLLVEGPAQPTVRSAHGRSA